MSTEVRSRNNTSSSSMVKPSDEDHSPISTSASSTAGSEAIIDDANVVSDVAALLDLQSDGGGMSTKNGDDWSDVKHSERKKKKMG